MSTDERLEEETPDEDAPEERSSEERSESDERAPTRRAMSGWLRALLAVVAAAVLIGALLGLRNGLADDPLERLSAEKSARGLTTTYQGSWYFPRGGPYILGFESPSGRATLTIDGRTVAAGGGRQQKRIVYQEGVRAVRFQAPAGARLLWHPPGRRGPLEYVPASSLSPRAPADARFAASVGSAPLDGVIASAIVLILLSLAVFLALPLFARVHWRTLGVAVAVGVCALAVRLYDLDGAGQTWDEDVNWSAGKNYITNWMNLDFAPRSWVWNMEHPPFMKYLAGIGAQFADGYGPARAISALMIALGCALMVPIGRRLGSLRVGALAGALAALSPHLIAHGKVVGHEAPTVFLWALAIWLALMAHDPPRGTNRDEERDEPADDRQTDDSWQRLLLWRMVVLGVVLGLAVFSRFVNVLLAPLIGTILLLQAPAGRRRYTVVAGLLVIAPVAAIVGFAIWPRLWSQPIDHLQEAWNKLKKPHSMEPFLGAITNQPPRHYFVTYLMATAPVGLLLGAAAWVGRAVAKRRTELIRTAVLGAWLLAPLIVMFSPVRQDGVRYIMPCLLCLAMMAALGLDFAVEQLGRVRQTLGGMRAFIAIAVAMVLYLMVVNARIHPYYLDYYGEQVGGPSNVAANKLFETAWWGEGIADAIDHVNQNAASGDRVHKSCVEPGHLTWLRGDLWARLARRTDRADWILVYQPSWRRCPIPADARLVHEVRAQGAPLLRVYRRPGKAGKQPTGARR